MPPLSQLVATLDAYWYVIVAVVIFLGAVWRSLPVELRDKIEREFPRIVGFVRLVIAVFPDLVNAFRAFRFQIIDGTAKRDALSHPPPPPKRQGFFRFPLLLLALALNACPLPPPDHCRPTATRCSPQGKPQRCSAGERWWNEPTAQPCAALGVTCCLALSPYGNRVHACVPQSACLEEPTLADVIEAADAAEGGAQ